MITTYFATLISFALATHEHWLTIIDKSQVPVPDLSDEFRRLLHVECDEHMMYAKLFLDYEHSQMPMFEELADISNIFNAIAITSNAPKLPSYCTSRGTSGGYRLLEFPLGECDGVMSTDQRSNTITYENRLQIVLPLDERLLKLQGGHGTFDVKCTLKKNASTPLASRFHINDFNVRLLAINVNTNAPASTGGHFIDDFVSLESSDVTPNDVDQLALSDAALVQAMPYNCYSSGIADKLVINGCPNPKIENGIGVSKLFVNDTLNVSRVQFRVPLSINKSMMRSDNPVLRIVIKCAMVVCTGSHLHALAGIPKCPYNDYCVPSVDTEAKRANRQDQIPAQLQNAELVVDSTRPIAVITDIYDESCQHKCEQLISRVFTATVMTPVMAHDTLTIALISVLSFMLGALLVATVWCLQMRHTIARNKCSQLNLLPSNATLGDCALKYEQVSPKSIADTNASELEMLNRSPSCA